MLNLYVYLDCPRPDARSCHQTNLYRMLEYPDGTGKTEKQKIIFLYIFLFIALLSISFVVVYVLNITINILVEGLFQESFM